MSLTNIELTYLAKKMNINLIAVCTKDELKNINHKVGGYIINLQNNHDGHGTHWVSFIIYQNSDHMYRALYHDPYGVPPPLEVENYIKKLNDYKIAYSTRQIQKINTTECGWYALCFLYNMQFKRTSNNMIDDYRIYMNKFSNDLNQELKILKQLFKPWDINFYSKTIKLIK